MLKKLYLTLLSGLLSAFLIQPAFAEPPLWEIYNTVYSDKCLLLYGGDCVTSDQDLEDDYLVAYDETLLETNGWVEASARYAGYTQAFGYYTDLCIGDDTGLPDGLLFDVVTTGYLYECSPGSQNPGVSCVQDTDCPDGTCESVYGMSFLTGGGVETIGFYVDPSGSPTWFSQPSLNAPNFNDHMKTYRAPDYDPSTNPEYFIGWEDLDLGDADYNDLVVIVKHIESSDPIDCCEINDDCDDGVACTVDSCVDAVCQNTPNDASCDADTTCADYYCDVDLDCQVDYEPDTTECRASTGDCDAAEFCSGDAAECPVDGDQPNGYPCDDGDTCTTNDTCTSGTCAGGPPLVCDDSNVCTDDSCIPATGCDYANNTLPCDDGVFCTLDDNCVGGVCVGVGDTCDDSNPCSDDSCDEDLNECTNVCNAISPFEPCCSDAACSSEEICQAGGVINIGYFWANCGDVGIKIDICLENLATPVGGFQMDICENPNYVCAGTSDNCETDADCEEGRPCLITGADPDCLTCVECEMTERTVLFDCVVNELDNGCCRVILFSKNPGGLINPGECDIVTIVYEISDAPECCDECIPIDGMGIILTDEYGYDILGVLGELGEVCPYECGDIEPGCASLVCSNDASVCVDDSDCTGGFPVPTCSVCAPGETCGDGDVDIFDILLEVDFALGREIPDDCQAGSRSNVPTGTPPNCLDPDGTIDILDTMVIIDMALDRQDCCSYYYGGKIY